MWKRRAVLAAMAAGILSACSRKSSILSGAVVYSGPEVTRVILAKGKRKLYLLNGQDVLRTYDVGLGYAPLGDKKFEGDGKTPEGRYIIDRRNPQSQYYLSLGISYPNAQDIAEARVAGKSPGGDIFIHGRAGQGYGLGRDWTAGCIAVSDRNIEEIWTMVKNGTVIDIIA